MSRQSRKERAERAAKAAEAAVDRGETPPEPEEKPEPSPPDPVDERERVQPDLAPEVSPGMPAEDDESEDEVPLEALIAALPSLRQTRRSPLYNGLRMFSAIVEEARSGYAATRLAYLEEALDVEFGALEQEGILEIAAAAMDEYGIPDVEHGVQKALESRAGLLGIVRTPRDEVAEAQDLADEKAAAAVEEDLATAEADEDEDPDAPGADE